MKMYNILQEFIQYDNKHYIRTDTNGKIVWKQAGDTNKGEYGYFDVNDINNSILEKHYISLSRQLKLERIINESI